MTANDLVAMRKTMGFTQAQMGDRLGLSARAYQELERAEGDLKARHVGAIERAALAVAVEQGKPMLAPAAVRREALELARLITG